MRVLCVATLRVINTHTLKQGKRALLAAGRIPNPMDCHAVLDGGTNGLQRVERIVRVLRHQADVDAAQLAPLRIGGAGDVLALETDRAAVDVRAGIQQPNRRHGRRRLTGTGLTHNRGNLAGLHGKRHVLHHRILAAVGHGQALDGQQWIICWGAHYFSPSDRIASDRRLADITVATMARPGSRISHHAVAMKSRPSAINRPHSGTGGGAP